MVKPGGQNLISICTVPSSLNETLADYCVNLIITCSQTFAYPAKNRDGAVVRVLAFYQHSPGSMLADIYGGLYGLSLICFRYSQGFPHGFLVFLPLQKPSSTCPNSNSTRTKDLIF